MAAISLHTAAELRAMPLTYFLGIAEAVTNDDQVISIFAACEWDELHDDGKLWVAGIVRETFARAIASSARLDALSPDTKGHQPA